MPKKHVLCFLIVLLVLLSSCENFMKGSGVKDELSKLVEEANAPEVELYIACDPKYGVVAPSGYVSYKKGQSFNLVFLENPGYQFAGWQVQDKTSLQQVQGALAFENPTAKETKAKLLTSTKNLYISPVCLELPQVESFYPSEIDNGVFANTPIRIKFNIAVQFPDQQMTGRQLVKVMQIYPLVQGEPVDISDYYNLPLLSDDEKTITLTPKAQELSAYIQNQNMEKLIRVKVSLNADINAMVNGKALYRYVPDNTDDAFYYRVNPHVEDTPPEKINFFVTRDELLYDELSASDAPSLSGFTPLESGVLEGTALSEVQAESVYSRMAGQYIYFYGEYKDTDSGFDSILVEEKFVNTKEGIPSPDKDWIRGDTSGLVKWDTATGSTRFILKYKIKSDDGAINLKITPYDFCGNQSPSQQYTIFKSTRIGLENVEPFNWLGGEVSVDNIYNLCLIDEDYSYIAPNDIPKTVRIAYKCLSEEEEEINGYNRYLQGHELREYLFKDIYMPPRYYSVFYKIDGRDYVPFEYHEAEEDLDTIKVASWIKTFDVDSIEGLKFKLLIEDALGNKEEKEYQFPGMAEIVCANDQMDPPLFFVSSEYAFDSLVAIDSNTYAHEQFEDNYFADFYDVVLCKNKNLIGPVKIFDPCELIQDTKIDSGIQIQSIRLGASDDNTGKQTLIMTLNDDAWKINENQNFDTLYMRYTTSDCDDDTQMAIWYIQQFEKNKTTCTFFVNTEELYGNGLNAVVWGKKDNVMSEEVIYTDNNNRFYHSDSIKDNAPPVFQNVARTMETFNLILSVCEDSTGYNYEEYIIHPEIKEFMSGLDYIEWWEEATPDIKYRAGHDFDWIEYLIPNWDLDSPKGKIHIRAADNKNNISECIFPYTFYDNIFTFEVMGKAEEDRRKFCIPNDIKNCKDFELIISREDGTAQLPCKLKYNINENESNYFSIRPNSTDYVINLSDEKMTDKCEELEKDDYYLEIQDSLVKIAFTATIPNPSSAYDSDNFGVSNAVYMYCGTISDFSSKIVFLENGAMLTSNYPVIVYTLVTKQPLSECKDWDIKQWDRRRRQIGKEYFAFNSSGSSDIYESPLDQIEPGECYIIVAHFSDGSIKYSSVRQK